MPAEYSNKYENGLEGFFEEPNTAPNAPSTLDTTSTGGKKASNPDKKKKEDIDSTLDEIFSNQ